MSLSHVSAGLGLRVSLSRLNYKATTTTRSRILEGKDECGREGDVGRTSQEGVDSCRKIKTGTARARARQRTRKLPKADGRTDVLRLN